MEQRFLLLIIAACLTGSVAAQGYRFTIRLDPVTPHAAADTVFFVAGNFNGWQPGAGGYRFHKTKAQAYELTIAGLAGPLEFKITRGDWSKVETTAAGAAMTNRKIELVSDSVIRITVAGWQDHFLLPEKRHTASPNVRVVENFYMPQLGRSRNLRIYLPEGYNSTPQKRYPVLYLQDGQNVFDAYTAYAGEWAVDEYLDHTKLPSCIVVAIDNGGGLRLNEYEPYPVKRIPRAEGDRYAAFLVKTLKPYIDGHYRTMKEKRHTSIAGSSMGGLISLYTALKYPGVFGGIGVFSPSFWVTEKKIYEDIRKNGAFLRAALYFYVGMQEGDTMPEDLLKAVQELQKAPGSRLTAVIRSGGRHNEEAWRKEFPLFYQALVSKNN
ncbi:alpha/beta hydrolase [Niabella drilacis]|uniref:Predicted hydrolase of the alpha/beta superfamily n=1 Tax=Niabella drilacis (strain DSM 25811 / CCM 8410 / CCUG 62505 / LMG 26954 / E90) TaxID=1285928 RepID=A0A1G6I5V8_NIADE|nr:alpha/beta hydrolase-fold protein [Niabella drilacis]SDC01425.1 Predicted hydrolase of the alpha/beta superfamily [Niabella drilacis]